MARLPVVGGDSGNWGTILNDYLQVSLNADGAIQPSAITAAGGVTSVNTVAPNTSGNVTLTAGNVGAVPSSSVGAANGVASLDGDSQLKSSQLPGSVVTSTQEGTVIQGTPTASGQTLVTTTQVGAFPTTAVLYNFSTVESPLSDGGNFAAFPHYSTNQLQVSTSGQATVPSGGGASLWTAATFTDCEVFATVEALGGSDIALFLRVTNPSGTWGGYRVKFQSDGAVAILNESAASRRQVPRGLARPILEPRV